MTTLFFTATNERLKCCSLTNARNRHPSNIRRGRNRLSIKIHELVSSAVDAVKKPVTVKMRTSWDDEHIVAVENARAVGRVGCKAVSMHGGKHARSRAAVYRLGQLGHHKRCKSSGIFSCYRQWRRNLT